MSGEVQVEKPALAAVVCQRYTPNSMHQNKMSQSIHFAIWKNTFGNEHLKVLPCLKKSQNRKLVYTMNTKLKTESSHTKSIFLNLGLLQSQRKTFNPQKDVYSNCESLYYTICVWFEFSVS